MPRSIPPTKPGEREMSPRGAIALGVVVAAAGLAILAGAAWGPPEKFHTPRWVIAGAGGAFLFFGSYLAICYALGYDPRRSEETLPPPLVQLAFFVPGLSLFALPFHWVAFGPGPREFSGSISLPFIAFSHRGGALSGRMLFGMIAVLIDLLLVGVSVKLLRKVAAE